MTGIFLKCLYCKRPRWTKKKKILQKITITLNHRARKNNNPFICLNNCSCLLQNFCNFRDNFNQHTYDVHILCSDENNLFCECLRVFVHFFFLLRLQNCIFTMHVWQKIAICLLFMVVWKWFAVSNMRIFTRLSSWYVKMEQIPTFSSDYDHCESYDANGKNRPFHSEFHVCDFLSDAFAKTTREYSMHLTYDICAKILHLHCLRRRFIAVNILTAELFTIIIKY